MPIVNGVYRPDFETNQSLPQWVPMDDDSSGAASTTTSFVDALKARMGSSRNGHDMAHAQPTVAPHEASAPMGEEHGLVAKPAGGMKSL